jgi:endonuclease YncB( thermonuclease family)
VFLHSTLVTAETLFGSVVRLIDGDTISVKPAQQPVVKVRISGIDAPESGQPWGRASKQNLASLCYGQYAQVDWHKTDKDGRIVGRVVANGMDVGLEQIRSGMAWHFKKYQDEQPPQERRLYAAAEKQARATGIGLWSQAKPLEPALARHPERRDPATLPAGCGAKRFCKEMASCDEAKFYLTVCGVSGLDRTGRGIPCVSSVCRQ